MYQIKTFNKISPVGLNRFDAALYEVGDEVQDPQGILVRSAKLLDLEFNPGLLAIARAAVADPPVKLLDEAASSIDTRTEVRIQKAFARMMQGRTSFIVAHRLSTIREADVILVMKDGHIVEQGNHDQLLAQGGFYAKLYNSQFEGVET